MSRHLHVALDRGMEGRLVQLNFSDAFDRIIYRGLLYKLRSIGIGGQLLYIVLKFLSDRRQRVRLINKVSASVHVISVVSQGSSLGRCYLYYTPRSSFTELGTLLGLCG